jgi:hypothetical protein
MKTKTILFTLFTSFFIHVAGMESPAAQVMNISDLNGTIFTYAHPKSKNSLELTCKSLNKTSNEFFKRCHINDFVDELYKIKHGMNCYVHNDAKEYVWLAKKCNDEHKNLLINYCLIDSAEKKGQLYPDKKTILHIILRPELRDQSLNRFFEKITMVNYKKHVKFYIPHSNVEQCIRFLKKDFDSIKQCSKELNCVVSDICSFFDKAISFENFADIYKTVTNKKYCIEQDIEKALKANNFAALVFLYGCMEDKGVEDYINLLQCRSIIVEKVETDAQRMLLAKAGYVDSLEIGFLFTLALQNNETEKARSFLKIISERGDDVNMYGDVLKAVFSGSCINMLPALFEAGFAIKPTDINFLTSDQIKTFVEVGHAMYGKTFWSNEYHKSFLHRAVQLNDLELVRYLLKIGAPTNALDDDNNKTPILYSLDNDDIFNLLLIQKEAAYDYRHGCLFTAGSSRSKLFIQQFVKQSSEKKIIQLFEHNFFKTINEHWITAASDNNKSVLLRFLLDNNKQGLSDQCKKNFLYDAIAKNYKEIVKIWLENGAHKNGVLIDQYDWDVSNKDILILLLNAGVNILDIHSNPQRQAVLQLIDNDNDIIECFKKHKKDIIPEQGQCLLTCAIQTEQYKFAKYLFNEGIRQSCTSVLLLSPHGCYTIFGPYTLIKDEEVKGLLFKDLVNTYVDNDGVLQFLLESAIADNSIDRVKITLQQCNKTVVENLNITDCVWDEKNKNILQALIDNGFNIISIQTQDSIFESWLKLLGSDALVTCKDTITPEQGKCLLGCAINISDHMLVKYLFDTNIVPLCSAQGHGRNDVMGQLLDAYVQQCNNGIDAAVEVINGKRVAHDQGQGLSAEEELLIKAILYLAKEWRLAKEWQKNDSEFLEILENKINSIKFSDTDNIYKRLEHLHNHQYYRNNFLYGKKAEVENAMAALAEINSDFRKLTEKDWDRRHKLVAKIDRASFALEQIKECFQEMTTVCKRPVADRSGRFAIINMLKNRLEQHLFKQYSFVPFNNMDDISLNTLPSKSSDREEEMFSILDTISKITDDQKNEFNDILSKDQYKQLIAIHINNALAALEMNKTKSQFDDLMIAQEKGFIDAEQKNRFYEWKKNNRWLNFKWRLTNKLSWWISAIVSFFGFW